MCGSDAFRLDGCDPNLCSIESKVFEYAYRVSMCICKRSDSENSFVNYKVVCQFNNISLIVFVYILHSWCIVRDNGRVRTKYDGRTSSGCAKVSQTSDRPSSDRAFHPHIAYSTNILILNRLVQQRGHVLLAIAMRGAEHHDAVLDRQRIQMVQHHMVRFRQQSWLALQRQITRKFDEPIDQ